MFALIWMTLLFSADAGESLKEKQHCAENPGYCITLPDEEITVQAGLCVEIPCSFTTPNEFTIRNLVWYKCEPTTENCGDSDIIYDSYLDKIQPEFKGRAKLSESDLSQKTCSIMIKDLKESDSGSYQLRVTGYQGGQESGFTFSPRATLSIIGLISTPRLEVPPLIVGQPATITCTAPGRWCFGPGPKLTWIWPGVEGKDYVTASEGRTSTLTFTPSSKHHYTDVTCKVTFTGNVATEHKRTLTVQPAQVKGTTHCDFGNCITLPDGEIRAEAGLCVEIPCSFDTSLVFRPEHAVWYKCEPTNENCTESDIIFDSENAYVASEFKGRVSLLESDMRIKTCTIMINDLKESDSGSYQLRLNGILNGQKGGYTFSPRATLSVKGLYQTPATHVRMIKEGEKTTITCTAPGEHCSGSAPKFTWIWPGVEEKDYVTASEGRTSTLTFTPSSKHRDTVVTCNVTLTGNIATDTKMTIWVDKAPLKEKQQCAENPGYCITLLDGEITAAAGLCAEIPCSFTTASEFTHQSLVWYKCEPTTENCGDSDIIYDSKNNDNVQSEFKGRVSLLESDLSEKTCSIVINDLKESDTGSYQLRVNGVQDGKESGFTFSPRATLSVRGERAEPRLEVPPLIVGQPATITCTAPGRYCPGPGPKLTWIWPGVEGKDYVTASEGRTSTLTFTPSSKHHYIDITCKVTFTGNVATEHKRTLTVQSAQVKGTTHCDFGNCITLPDGEIRAEAGLCVEIPCSFDASFGFGPEHAVWYKCEPTNENCTESDIIFDSENAYVASEFKGRVSLLESDMRIKTCTIMIKDLKETDSGSYQLRLNGKMFGKKGGYTFSPRATLSVKGLSQKPNMTIPQLVEGEETTLTCAAPGFCSGSDPKFSWRWSRAGEDFRVPDPSIKNLGRTSTLSFVPSAEQHGAEVTCKVTFPGDVVTEEKACVNVRLSEPGSTAAAAWAIAGVSLCVNVLCFILIFFLWRKKMKFNQDIRMCRSPGDDGSAQPLH